MEEFFLIKQKKNLLTYNNIRKITTSHKLQGNDYTTLCLVYYPYFEKHYKLIVIDLSKQQKLDADPKPKQQIKFTGNIKRAESGTKYLIIEEAKEIVLGFSKGTVEVL